MKKLILSFSVFAFSLTLISFLLPAKNLAGHETQEQKNIKKIENAVEEQTR